MDCCLRTTTSTLHRAMMLTSWCVSSSCIVCSQAFHKLIPCRIQFGVPPWHADGTVNPSGVLERLEPFRPVHSEWKIEEYSAKRMWSCKTCSCRVEPARQNTTVNSEDALFCKTCSRKKAMQAPVADQIKQYMMTGSKAECDSEVVW